MVPTPATLSAESRELCQTGLVVGEKGADLAFEATAAAELTRKTMEPKSAIHRLSTAMAPAACGRRGLPRATKVTDPAFWGGYDNDTLVYDCVWLKDRGIIRLTMPKLYNFKPTLHSAAFTVDRQPIARKKLIQNFKYDTLDMVCDYPATELAIATGGLTLNIPIHTADPTRYDGCNVLYTQIKNDDLNWVYDWGQAHQRNHGADAILVTNNGSTSYTSEELRKTLASIPHLKVADVLEAPLPYGASHSTCTGGGFTEFLQPALQNTLRDRFFGRARAVLLCDVDELVRHPNNKSIFDATVGSVFKYKSFYGAWRYAPETNTPVRHADHILAKADGVKCATKYCVVPNSRLGRMTWGVHSLQAINRHIFRPFNRFRFFHCRQISTSWKTDRSATAVTGTSLDPQTRQFMATTFPETNVKP